jgi:uncharacterized membrane protein
LAKSAAIASSIGRIGAIQTSRRPVAAGFHLDLKRDNANSPAIPLLFCGNAGMAGRGKGLSMLEFLVALAVFVLAHALPARPGLRGRLVDALGRRMYLVLYSALSLALLAWLISAAIRAPEIVVWEQIRWQADLALIAVPLALVLVIAGLIKPNPLSVSFRTEGHDPARPGLLAITRHPVLWGFGLWGGAHIAVNGDLVGIILFGALTFFALAGTTTLDRRKARIMGEAEWRRLAADTSNAPFVAILKGRVRPGIDWPLLAGIAVSAIVSATLLAGGHLWLFGTDPLSYWR